MSRPKALKEAYSRLKADRDSLVAEKLNIQLSTDELKARVSEINNELIGIKEAMDLLDAQIPDNGI